MYFDNPPLTAADTPLTERLDYFSATLTISLTLLYSLVRILSLQTPLSANRLVLPLGAGIACLVLAHFTYLLSFPLGSFPYGYHTAFNVSLAIVHNLIWIAWSAAFYLPLPTYTIGGYTLGFPHPYPPNDPRIAPRPSDASTPSTLVLLTTAAMSFELLDFAPLFRTMDPHSLWHASTIPLTIAWWAFLTTDAIELEGSLLNLAGRGNGVSDEKMPLTGGPVGLGGQILPPSTPTYAQLAAGVGMGGRQSKSPGKSPKGEAVVGGDKGDRVD